MDIYVTPWSYVACSLSVVMSLSFAKARMSSVEVKSVEVHE